MGRYVTRTCHGPVYMYVQEVNKIHKRNIHKCTKCVTSNNEQNVQRSFQMSKMYKMSKYPTGSSYKMSKSPLSSKSVHHSSGNVQVSSKSTSKPQTLRLYENLRSLILKANGPSLPFPPSPRSTQTGLHAYSNFNY